MNVSTMPERSKIVVDHNSGISGLVRLTDVFDVENWSGQICHDKTYVFGKELFYKNFDYLKELIEKNYIKVIYSHPAEGSETLIGDFVENGIDEIAKQKKFLIIAGAEIGPEYASLVYDSCMAEVYINDENMRQCARVDEIYNKTNKPYKFLFLNGMYRWHRKYLIDRFKKINLLDQSLWSCLDQKMAEIHLLDKKYELPVYQSNINVSELAAMTTSVAVKQRMFNGQWGDGQLCAESYIDTYFSLVTETVTESYSFRTEKIWKPIAMGHPWIAVANASYYKDIRNLGFKTFEHIIDESFDQIEDTQQRVSRIADVVEDLCKSDLGQFLKESRDICTYNRQHFVETATKIRNGFSNRLLTFLNQHT
jgi:hypothetical protein